ncbi:MAG: hypothetical protein ACI3X4_08700 [Bacteroidaceae bacterium]
MNTYHSPSSLIAMAALMLGTTMLTSCDSGEEEKAQQMLQEARAALRHRQYSEARDSIFSLRQKHPTAIDARRQGILLLDSIELQAASDSLAKAEGEEWERLSVKKKFYERKLQEDERRAAQERRNKEE